jgi:hypothetical protein
MSGAFFSCSLIVLILFIVQFALIAHGDAVNNGGGFPES